MGSENIICFSKDWNEDHTSNHHVMTELAKTRRVLWLNSVATRAPRMTSSRDLGKIAGKLREFARGPVEVHENLWVYTPVVVPLPHSRAARRLNRCILQTTLRVLRARLGMKDFQLWSFLPNVTPYVGMGESLLVYYCTDEWSLFSYVDGDNVASTEAELCKRADMVFATSHALAQRKREINPETHLATHGVDHAHFATALAADTRVPDDLAALPRPIIGFYGTIQYWVDLELLQTLATRHPQWSFVLLGGVHVDVSALTRLGNVHFLGQKPHAALPRYCKGFDAGIIPYVLDERMMYVNPIKLREYLSAGLPVVSTAVPEVLHYQEHCTVASCAEEFAQGLEDALARDTPQKRAQRSAAMASETWAAKVARIESLVDAAARGQGRGSRHR